MFELYQSNQRAVTEDPAVTITKDGKSINLNKPATETLFDAGWDGVFLLADPDNRRIALARADRNEPGAYAINYRRHSNENGSLNGEAYGTTDKVNGLKNVSVTSEKFFEAYHFFGLDLAEKIGPLAFMWDALEVRQDDIRDAIVVALPNPETVPA